MAAKPKEDSQSIIDEYTNLRLQGVSRRDAITHMAEQSGRSFDAIRLLTARNLPSHDPSSEDPLKTDFAAFGTSTLYGPEGEVKLQWVKRRKQEEEEQFRQAIEAMADKLPKVKPTEPRSKTFRENTIAVYPMGDPHIGAYSWPMETGVAFDLEIAERNLCGAVARLVDTVPSCEEALIINVGDFFHSDNFENRTSRSGHALDVDTRWSKVLRVGVKAMRQCIESALRKHKHVTVINAIGNHDDHSALFLSVALSNIYEDEPRVTINEYPTAMHFHEFGKNMIVVTHGHSIKMDKVPLVAAAEEPEMWGRTTHRWGVTGHIHTDTAKEYNGMKVESFRTLAGRDAWTASMGYRAGRDMKAVLLHSEFGEVERHVVSVEMMENAAL